MTLDTTPEFISYKRTYIQVWAAISYVIHHLEKMLTKYQVPHAVINGKRLSDLSEMELRNPSQEQLFDCLINHEEVGDYIKIPTRMFKGPNGTEIACVTV